MELMRRSPQEVVDTLAYSLKEGRQGDEIKVADLVKKTSMNHVTISYYLDLIMHVQNNLPKIEFFEKKRNSFVKILKEVEIALSDEDYMILSLFDKGAFSKSTAIPINEHAKDVLSKLLKSSILAEVSEKIYLLPDGIVAGVELADKRMDKVLFPSKQKIFDSGEIKFEDWNGFTIVEKNTESADQEYISAANDLCALPMAI